MKNFLKGLGIGVLAGALVLLFSSAYATEGSDVSVGVTTGCELGLTSFEGPGYYDTGVMGSNDTDHFSGSLVNSGNTDLELHFNLSIYPEDDPTLHPDVDDENGSIKPMPLDGQQGNYTFISNLPSETQTVNNTRFQNFLIHFASGGTFGPGNYTAEAVVDYVCDGNITEDEDDELTELSTSEDNETENDDNGGDEEENGQTDYDVVEDTDGNVTDEVDFEIIEIPADGDAPDDVGDEDDVDFELDADAIIERLNETGEVDTNVNETEDVELALDAVIEELEEAAELDTDVDEEEDADPQEGDSDAPGETPEPEPEPEPEPDPRLEIEITPVNHTYDAVQGQFAPAALEVENFADEPVEDFELDPLIDETDPDWGVETADIDSIEPEEVLERDVYVQPPSDIEPGEYTVPVTAEDEEVVMDIDYFTVDVEESEFDPFIEIVEAPQNINLEVEEEEDIPILVENVGETNLTNIGGQVQNIDSCGNATVSEVDFMDENESESMTINFNASEETEECETTLIVSSEDGAYSFADMTVTVVPEEALLPREQEVPIVAISWTLLLVAYAVMRKKYDLDSVVVNIPFILLIIGQTIIILYLVAHYYGLAGSSILPF